MSSNRSTNINFYEVSSNENVPSIVHNLEEIGPKFIFSLKVGKLVITASQKEEERKKIGLATEENKMKLKYTSDSQT
jgi:hypothetical protein